MINLIEFNIVSFLTNISIGEIFNIFQDDEYEVYADIVSCTSYETGTFCCKTLGMMEIGQKILMKRKDFGNGNPQLMCGLRVGKLT